MLSLLHIENIAVIEQADISFDKGFNVLTGETGAGKTTLALSLLRLVPDPPGVIKKGKIEINGQDILNMPIKSMQKMESFWILCMNTERIWDVLADGNYGT